MKRALVVGALALACRAKAPAPVRTPEQALARLQQALTTGTPAPEEASDPRALAEIRLLAQAVRIRLFAGEDPLTRQVWRASLEHLDVESTPRRALAPHASLLGDGRCERVAPLAVPDDQRNLVAADPAWPEEGRALRARLGDRPSTLVAGVYRCGAPPPLRAFFLRGPRGDLVVGALEPTPAAVESRATPP